MRPALCDVSGDPAQPHYPPVHHRQPAAPASARRPPPPAAPRARCWGCGRGTGCSRTRAPRREGPGAPSRRRRTPRSPRPAARAPRGCRGHHAARVGAADGVGGVLPQGAVARRGGGHRLGVRVRTSSRLRMRSSASPGSNGLDRKSRAARQRRLHQRRPLLAGDHQDGHGDAHDRAHFLYDLEAVPVRHAQIHDHQVRADLRAKRRHLVIARGEPHAPLAGARQETPGSSSATYDAAGAELLGRQERIVGQCGGAVGRRARMLRGCGCNVENIGVRSMRGRRTGVRAPHKGRERADADSWRRWSHGMRLRRHGGAGRERGGVPLVYAVANSDGTLAIAQRGAVGAEVRVEHGEGRLEGGHYGGIELRAGAAPDLGHRGLQGSASR